MKLKDITGKNWNHWKWYKHNGDHQKASNRDEITAHAGYNSYRPLSNEGKTKAGEIRKAKNKIKWELATKTHKHLEKFGKA